ncbi:MAG: type I 3-dehydroquinate dehydratase [Nitrososphaerota archaeon]|nr:type I 3-dehydroquinate dehydratase [Nitrososphaerota archaeon]
MKEGKPKYESPRVLSNSGSGTQFKMLQDLVNKRSFRLCLSVFARDPSKLGEKLEIARRLKPNLVELRLDYLRRIDERTMQEIRRMAGASVILTLRSRAEGGKSSLEDGDRASLLKRMASFHRCYIDVEMSTLAENPGLVGEFGSRRLIASYHDFSKTPSERKLHNLIESAPKGESVYAIKIVCKANSFEDNRRVLSLYDEKMFRGSSRIKLIAFCLGEYGIYSRLASLYCGAPFAYTSLPEEETAPGQLDIGKMRSILGLSRRS